MPPSHSVRRRGTRIVAELGVIIVGVLLALAADRWNQARSDLAVEAAYLERFVEEIAEDSARADSYLRGLPSLLASLDSLMDFVDGSPPPPNMVATVVAVSAELTLPPAVAWTEIQASNSLGMIRDPQARKVLTAYYGARERWLLQWSRQNSRGRDPLWNALYRTGLFDPNDQGGSPSPLQADAFREWPDMGPLLLAVGSGHYFQRIIAEQVLAGAHASLEALRGTSDGDDGGSV